jgi:hypothetical protein
VRAWLQAQHWGWLTPRRLRGMTIALFVAAFGVSSVGLSGSTAARHHVGHGVVLARSAQH